MRLPPGTWLPLVLLWTVLAACGSEAVHPTPVATPAPVTLTVFGPISATLLVRDLGVHYQQTHPLTRLAFHFDTSPLLVRRLITGEAADLLITADQITMKLAVDEGLVIDARLFARNKLAVIVPLSNRDGIHSLHDLARPGVKLSIAPVTTAEGRYFRQALDNLANSPEYGPAFKRAVLANSVPQTDLIHTTEDEVLKGSSYAIISYRSDVTPAIAGKVRLIEMPPAYTVIAQFPVAVVKTTPHPDVAQAFLNYLLSADNRRILAKYQFESATG